ncbi:MAG TPA: hypothetical protein VFO60_01780, partial [Candidatus Dormibacteraeota bacterium]|nr:hypothetical protein [Candidatus Dormibacteraeota bacterium]
MDAPSPAGHNWLYSDYFPDAGLVISSGDTVDFAWSQGSPDGAHTATLVKQGTTLGEEIAANPPATPDTDDGAGANLNGAAFGPTDPSCGSSTTPCPYDGSADVSSGVLNNAPNGPHFFVTITGAPGTTITFMCRIHPGMAGTLKISSGGGEPVSTPAQVAAAAASEYATRTASALGAEARADTEAVTSNGNGTHTITMTAGTAVPGVEILEMLPQDVHVATGDSVRWFTSTIEDIHTVTFPAGRGSDSIDPFQPPVCEGAGAVDTPAPNPGSPPSFGCGGEAESPFLVAPVGPTTISSPSTAATSGLIGSAPSGFPSTYAFTFSSAGVFTYQCRIHDHMRGTVAVTNAPGYLMAASDGGVFPFGAAPRGKGSLGNVVLNKPVVGITQTGDGNGYWMVASDGGIFPFGDAGGFGSTGAIRLNQPIVGMAPTPDGQGYWLVAADGGIFPFGDAGGYGSTGA